MVASAYDAKINGIYYNFSENEATVTSGGTSYSGAVVIPESVFYTIYNSDGTIKSSKTYKVTSIGSNAFLYDIGLTSITIPNSVTSIGESAFYYCYRLTSMTIPNSVTSIGDYAFEDCSGLTSVTIGNSVTSIGYRAFYKCTSLTSVTIPNSVTSIGNSAFDDCSGLTSITIGSGLTSIDNSAFSGCTNITSMSLDCEDIGSWVPANENLKTLTLGEHVKTIGNYAFYYCSSLTSITIGSGLTSIGKYAFLDCSGLQKVIVPDIAAWCGIKFGDYYANPLCYAHHLFRDETKEITDLVIPNNVTSIGDWVFSGCSGLTSVTIPNSVTSIGISAFYGCSGLQKVIVPDIAAWCGIKFGDYYANPLYYAHRLFKDETTEITDLVIPNSVTSIGNYAFRGCSGLTSITIPNSVTSIGTGTFYYCIDLTSVTIPNSVKSIGIDAFRSCTSLTSVTIPNSVTSIGDGAFWGCRGLTVKCYAEKVPETGSDVFSGIASQTTLLVPEKVIDLYKATSPWSEFGTIMAIEDAESNIQFADAKTKAICVAYWDWDRDGELSRYEAARVYTIGYKFANSEITSFNELQYFTGLTSIGEWAFDYCRNLTSITIPNGVTSIESSAFYGCSGLTSLTIGNGVTSIGDFAFDGCCGLTSITIPNSVNSIGEYAFYGCSDLTSITIPNSVISIGDCAFSGCICLTSIKVEAGNTKYDSRNGCNAIIETATNILITGCKNTVIPNGVTRIGNYAFRGCTSLTSLTIPNSVTSIGSAAFDGCRGLISVTIPNSVTSIGEYAFAVCFGLASIICNAIEPPSCGSDVFYGVDKEGCKLFVPVHSEGAYITADQWKDFYKIIYFYNITDIETPINSLAEDMHTGIIYDLNGRKLPERQKGLNIIRMNDGTMKKVLLK